MSINSSQNSASFKVSDAIAETIPHSTGGRVIDAIAELSKLRVEAGDANADCLVRNQGGPSNGFLLAVHLAFASHFPLQISPDDVWLCIGQGFGNHVTANAEALRAHFFPKTKTGDPKEKIEIIRDGFIKGNPDNDWMDGFAEFSNRIAERIGPKRDLLAGSFSTTGPIEKAVSEVVLMNAMKSYIDFSVLTRCGIPEIILTGTTADWESVKTRANNLSEFGCKKWIGALLPVLQQFVNASKGQVEREFWRSFYKVSESSGGPYVTGAVNVLFPYLKNPIGTDWSSVKSCDCSAVNEYANTWDSGKSRAHAPTTAQFPDGLSCVPFKWKYYGRPLEMAFLAGFVGASQDKKTLAIRPAIGWGVADAR